MNETVETGSYPKLVKIARVTPNTLYKFSFLSIYEKSYEDLYAFLRDKSTNDAFLISTKECYSALNSNKNLIQSFLISIQECYSALNSKKKLNSVFPYIHPVVLLCT